jgi:hypothetical protein
VHASLTPGPHHGYILYSGVYYLWILILKLASILNSEA